MNDYHENITAEQIRAQMDYVRNELGGDVEQVVKDAGSLGDVSAYVKAQPIGWMIAAAAAGYLLVPSNKNRQAQSSGQSSGQSNSPDESSSQASATQKRTLAGAAFGLATTLATRLITKKITEAGMGLFSGNQHDSFNQVPASVSSTYVTENGNNQ